MLRAIIFDIGNVLLEFDFRIAFEKIAPLSDSFNAEALAEVERLKNLCEVGHITRADFENEAAAALKFRHTPADFSAIWSDIFSLNPPMIEFVKSVHGKLPLYLLSNTSAIHLDHTLEKYPIFHYFADGIYSHEVGLAKPDPAIFLLAARRFGVAPESAAFVDDLLSNVKSARKVGFRAFHYNARDHDVFVEEISTLL